MEIAKNTVVTVQYELFDAQGNLIEEGQEPMVYLHGDYGNTLPKIEKTLEGKKIGYETTIPVEPEDAFGEYDASLVKIEPRHLLPEPIEIGMQFEGTPEDDEEEAHIFTVTDIAKGPDGQDQVVLDGNHPLAGIALRFKLNVVDVRKATDEEIAHGHAHGPHGHDDEDDDDDDDDDQNDHFRNVPILQ